MALRADAAGDRVYISTTLPAPATTGLTVMGWFKISVDRNDFSTYWRTSSAGTLNTVATDTGGLGVNLFTTGGSLTDTYVNTVSEWVHIAVTNDNGTTVQYVTPYGGSIVSQSGSLNSSTPGELCILGRANADGAEWANGCAAYVRVFASALTQAQVETERASATAVLTAWADWPLDADLNDDSGNARTLTVVSGTPAYETGPSLGTTASAGHASGTGAASAPAAAVTAPAGHASGTGTAGAVNPSVAFAAGHASGTGTAPDPAVRTDPNVPAGHASGTGAASDAAVNLAAAAELASGTGTAHQPTVQADGATTAAAGHAAGSGAAHNAAVSTSETAAAGHAAGTGAASSPTPGVTPSAGHASATGTASAPAVALAAPAGHASGTGTAYQPTVTTSGATADAAAGHASATGAAHDPTVAVSTAEVGSWGGLIALLADARQGYQRPELSCPNDGEPYQADASGQLVCPFDGHRPGGSGTRTARLPAGTRDWGGLRKAMTGSIPGRPSGDPPGWGPAE